MKNYTMETKKLWVDFVETRTNGKIGMTILPGRKDWNRDLDEDIRRIEEENIEALVCLITENEYEFYGVPELKKRYSESKLEVRYHPIIDQGIPKKEHLLETLDWIEEKLTKGKNVLLHCVGGLGRTGLVAASYLVEKEEIKPEIAIKKVRKARSERAIETKQQEDFILKLYR